MVVRIHSPNDAPLLEIGFAVGHVGLRFGAGQSRQEHGRQNGDNGDDDQQFDECESPPKSRSGMREGFGTGFHYQELKPP